MPAPRKHGGSTIDSIVLGTGNNAQVLLAEPGSLLKLEVYSMGSEDVCIVLVDKATNPTAGSETVKWRLPCKAGGGNAAVYAGDEMLEGFDAGIAIYALSGVYEDGDTTGITTGGKVIVNYEVVPATAGG